TAGPHCRMAGSPDRCIDNASRRPTVRARVVSTAGVEKLGEKTIKKFSAPDDHFAAGRIPHCRVADARVRCVGRAGSRPTISVRIVFTPGVKRGTAIPSTPDNHFAAAPYYSVRVSASWRVSSVCSCPTIGTEIVSPAGVGRDAIIATPDDHFAAAPYYSV